MTVTIEQIPRGPLPAWVFDHSIQQAIDPRSRDEGGPSRLLFLHSGSLARDRFLSLVIDQIGIVDRTNHLTLGGLIKKLFADFREPRVLSSNPALEQTIHRLMQVKASELAFPVLHPHPDWEWPITKTRNLLELDSVLRFQHTSLEVLEEHLSGLHSVLDISKTFPLSKRWMTYLIGYPLIQLDAKIQMPPYIESMFVKMANLLQLWVD